MLSIFLFKYIVILKIYRDIYKGKIFKMNKRRERSTKENFKVKQKKREKYKGKRVLNPFPIEGFNTLDTIKVMYVSYIERGDICDD